MLLNHSAWVYILPAKYLMQNTHDQVVREQMAKEKNKAGVQHSKTTKNLPILSQHQRVFVQAKLCSNKWASATVTKMLTASQPRSYAVETTDGTSLKAKSSNH